MPEQRAGRSAEAVGVGAEGLVVERFVQIRPDQAGPLQPASVQAGDRLSGQRREPWRRIGSERIVIYDRQVWQSGPQQFSTRGRSKREPAICLRRALDPRSLYLVVRVERSNSQPISRSKSPPQRFFISPSTGSACQLRKTRAFKKKIHRTCKRAAP